MGARGFVIDKDLSGWLRPLSIAVFGLRLVGLLAVLLGTGASPLISLGIAVISAALILIEFNVLRRKATEDDVVTLGGVRHRAAELLARGDPELAEHLAQVPLDGPGTQEELPQPLAAQQVRAGGRRADPGATEPLDRFRVERVRRVAVGQ
jgi:hypothetical protein